MQTALPTPIRRLAVAAVVLIGACLRFSHLGWDGGSQLHPDERAILFIASRLDFPASPAAALDAPHSSLNPLRRPDGQPEGYAYGHLPLYAEVGMGALLRLVCAPGGRLCASLPPDSLPGRLLNVAGADRYTHLTWVGRALSALADSATVLVIYWLARDLYSPAAGLVAAACGALAVLHIQNAHFGTVDAPLALFSTLTIWQLAIYARTERRAASLAAGLCAGLAIACKASAGLLAVPLLAAHWGFPAGRVPGQAAIRWPAPRDPPALWLALGLAAAVFVLTNPYALLDAPTFLAAVGGQAAVISGAADWPFTRQYLGTPPLLYVLDQQARWTLGLPLTAASLAALLWAGASALRRPRPDGLVVAVWSWGVLISVGLQLVKFPRYLLPATPAWFALVGGLIVSSPGLAGRPRRQVAVGVAVLLPTLLYAGAFMQMYAAPHPWIAASRWIYRELPPGVRIVSERWDDPLPLDLTLDGRGYLREGFVSSRLIDPFAEPDDRRKLAALADQVAGADYIILSSSRLYGVIPRLHDRYPLTAAYYRALFAGELGFRLERTFSRYPQIFGLTLFDDTLVWPRLADPGLAPPAPALSLGPADESFTVYDHPLVLVFRNEHGLSRQAITAAILRRVQP